MVEPGIDSDKNIFKQLDSAPELCRLRSHNSHMSALKDTIEKAAMFNRMKLDPVAAATIEVFDWQLHLLGPSETTPPPRRRQDM
jgi:hypothetical protein